MRDSVELLGLAGGSLTDRAQFARRCPPRYLYIEGWNDELAPALAKEFILALHPHVYTKTHCMEDALRLLDAHPELRLIPDTAHLWVVNESPVEVINRVWDRIIAIHLKDWKAEYGRSSHRYARGFTELGNGCVDLDSVLTLLKDRPLGDRWLVVEQDRTAKDISLSVSECADWLEARGVGLRRPKSVVAPVGERPTVWGRLRHFDEASQMSFLASTLKARTLTMDSCYGEILRAFTRLIECRCAALWAFNPRDEALCLLAAEPSELTSGKYLKIADKLTVIAIERQGVTEFDLGTERPGDVYGYPNATLALPAIIQQFGADRMVAVPLLNPNNANHVRAVVSLFPSSLLPQSALQDLFCLGMEAARAIDAALDEICLYRAGSANELAGHCRQLGNFQEGVVKLLQDSLGAEGCTLFLIDQLGQNLRPAATTGLAWSVPKEEQTYQKGEGLTGSVWARHEPLLTVNSKTETAWRGKSTETVKDQDQDACLFVPLAAPSGQVLGVIRCRNNQGDPSRMFSYNDAAVVDAICQVAAPHLQILLGEQRRAKAIYALTHELRNPIVTILGASQWMTKRFERHGIDPEIFFEYDYLGDIDCWTALMVNLLDNAQFYGLKSESIRLHQESTLLMSEVAAPSVRQMQVFLKAAGFSKDAIEFKKSTFHAIPALLVDKKQMFQVFFNMLSNGAKYHKTRESLRIVIEGGRTQNGFEIYFRDYGIGIDPDYTNLIFEEGVRGPDAHLKHVTGQGLGLWVVRQIIQAHDGEVRVTHTSDPTEFTVCLPLFLARCKASPVSAFIRCAIDRLEPALRRRSFNPGRVDFSDLLRLPPLWVEEEAFVQVFYELLSNCVAYALSDRSAFNVSWHATIEGNSIVLRIQDTGLGLDPRYAEEIFLPGARRPRPTDPVVEGRGNGLALCRSVIERHGGTIRCTGFGQPTEFTICLPAVLQTKPLTEHEGRSTGKP